MKPLKTKLYLIVLPIFLLLSTVWNILPVFSQEIPLQSFKWYYCPRAYPYDTIPGGAFENAVDQRDAFFYYNF
jgi:hypothetical protein